MDFNILVWHVSPSLVCASSEQTNKTQTHIRVEPHPELKTKKNNTQNSNFIHTTLTVAYLFKILEGSCGKPVSYSSPRSQNPATGTK